MTRKMLKGQAEILNLQGWSFIYAKYLLTPFGLLAKSDLVQFTPPRPPAKAELAFV